MSKLLIDAGRSERGWSRIGNFFKCPQLFAYQERIGLQLIPASALTRGSMGHVTQAHQHAIWGCQQGGCFVDDVYHTDAEAFMAPEDAVIEWCDRYGGHEHLDRMMETFRRYMATHPEPPGRIVAVEYPISAVLGEVKGQWGLWVYDEHEGTLISRQTQTPITVTPLNVPGHEDHGKPITMTRRLDLVVEDRQGRLWIWDHKNQANVQPNRSVDAYAIDGGFAAFRIMGKQAWPNFAGLMLNLIQTQSPWRVARPTVPPTPGRDRHFAQMLWRAEHQLAALDVEKLSPWEWPKAMHETTCYGRYGSCGATRFCFYGKSALD